MDFRAMVFSLCSGLHRLHPKRGTRLGFACLVATSLFLVPLVLSGCGGSGKSPAPAPGASVYITPYGGDPFNNSFSANPTPTYLTRATENTVSDDAKVLATRQSFGPYLLLDSARIFDADLARIRAAYPAVSDVHARALYTPKDLLVTVKQSTPWIAKWRASAALPDDVTSSDLTTGEPKLDALLTKFDATRIGYTSDYEEDGVFFQLEFGQSLNMGVLADMFADSSASFVSVAPNEYVGDGDDIDAALTQTGEKIYTFTQGYGDCPAGCTGRYIHTYTIATNGAITEKVEGTPPPVSEASGDSRSANGGSKASRVSRLSRIKSGSVGSSNK